MFDEIRFNTIERLPDYVFTEVNTIKMAARRSGDDIIDFSMGNPEGRTPQHMVDKLCESAQKDKTHGYLVGAGICKICSWHKRKYDAYLDPETEAVAVIGSKEGFVHLVQAVINPGDIAVVPYPEYPTHTQAFLFAGGKVAKMPLKYNEKLELDENKFFEDLQNTLHSSFPKPKYVVVNFPHNPTTVTVQKSFYERLIALSKQESFYIISNIAYADLTFEGYKTLDGAKDVAVECYMLSKSYNMASCRIGFMCENKRLCATLKKIKSWPDYGMFTPIQVATNIALDGEQNCVDEICKIYEKRRDVMIEAFENASWKMNKPNSSMFIWAKIPPQVDNIGSLEFSKQLLAKAKVAVSPGIEFDEGDDGYVHLTLIENENRIRQATRNAKKYLKEFQ